MRKITGLLAILLISIIWTACSGTGSDSGAVGPDEARAEFLAKYAGQVITLSPAQQVTVREDGRLLYALKPNGRCLLNFEGEIITVTATDAQYFTVDYRYSVINDNASSIRCLASEPTCSLDKRDCEGAVSDASRSLGSRRSVLVLRTGSSRPPTLLP